MTLKQVITTGLILVVAISIPIALLGPQVSVFQIPGLILVFFGNRLAALLEGTYSRGCMMKPTPGWIIKCFGYFLITIFPFVFSFLVEQ